MTITEKAAYLRGLVEGQGLDPEAGEGKLWHVLSEIVTDLAGELSEMRDRDVELADSLSDAEIRLDYLEEFVQDEDADYYVEDRDDRDDYYPFGGSHSVAADEEEEESDEDSLKAEIEVDSDTEIVYEVECPNCGERIEFGDAELEEGAISCPNCGATLEFEMPEDAEDAAEEKDGLLTEFEPET